MIASMFPRVPEERFFVERRSEFEDFEQPLKSSGRVLCHFRSGESVLQLGMDSGCVVLMVDGEYDDGAAEDRMFDRLRTQTVSKMCKWDIKERKMAAVVEILT